MTYTLAHIAAITFVGLFLYLVAASLMGKFLKGLTDDDGTYGAGEGAFPADRFGEGN
jgi:hypothetical protein